MSFYSDNAAPVAPEIFAAIAAANRGDAPPYGADDISAEVERTLCALFERELTLCLVATGTASNALSLAVLTPPYGVIFCHERAHVALSEAGAPEFFTNGARLCPVGGADGKIDAAQLARAISLFARGGVQTSKPACLSLTQQTEAGSIYTLDEISRLTQIAKAHGLRVYMDGARFANAVAALGCSPAAASWRAGIDILSFGATKNGALAAEAILLFDPQLRGDLAIRHKRSGHLWSKQRFMAAQFAAYLKDDLWLVLARRANRMAGALAQALAALPGVSLARPAPGNEVFVHLRQDRLDRLRQSSMAFVAMEEEGRSLMRFVASHATTQSDIDALVAALS